MNLEKSPEVRRARIDCGGCEERESSMESTTFVFEDVEWSYKRSQSLGTTASQMVKVGLKQVSVTCKKCGHSWTARGYGDGQFLSGLGFVSFECPNCEASERVSYSLFETKPN
jgi:predicted RNA-binding Zn-ribbon protein involved in translation (DUF1610 family)